MTDKKPAGVLTLRLDDVERQEVTDAAAKAGVSASEWIRLAIREQLRRAEQPRVRKGLQTGEGRTLGAREVAVRGYRRRTLPPPPVRRGGVNRQETPEPGD